jgi:AraC family transcriptional regulator, exoenzyme S synthesis regulatory protein ExsA
MQIIQVPEATRYQSRIAADDITFVDYRDKGGPFRTRVLFDRCAVSFVQNGQKQIYRAAENTVLTPGHGMLIPEGNSIIAEHSNNAEPYGSVIIFFPRSIGQAFIAGRRSKAGNGPMASPYIYFKTNAYISEYVRNIKSLIAAGQQLSRGMALLKVNELLTALDELAPQLLPGMFGSPADISLKTVVENNLFGSLTLDELAFLSNRSLSSFKRDFEKAYGLSPQKYIRERKLEIACTELAKGKSASELYLDFGYQHVSNFNTAFKRKYGVTPADYRESA